MEYNTARPNMSITEYGRNIQKMINYAITIEDSKKKNKMVKDIIAVMSLLNPQSCDIGDYRHKLWDHLYIMSDFKLNVDSPYPMPSKHIVKPNFKGIKYPSKNILFKHYGKNIELIIEKAITMKEGQEKENLTYYIANCMKKLYLTWNKDSVNDEVITNHLNQISGGKLKLNENARLNITSDILQKTQRKRRPIDNTKRNNNYKRNRKN